MSAHDEPNRIIDLRLALQSTPATLSISQIGRIDEEHLEFSKTNVRLCARHENHMCARHELQGRSQHDHRMSRMNSLVVDVVRQRDNVEYGRLQISIKADRTVKCAVELLLIYDLLLFKLLLSKMFRTRILQFS